MKKKNSKKDKKKNKVIIPKELLILLFISLVLLLIGLFVFKSTSYRVALSVILGCAPYGYVLLKFLDKNKFSKFGKLSIIISCFVRVILGTFIGVAASIVVIGTYLIGSITSEESN